LKVISLSCSLFTIWGVDPLGLGPLPFKSKKDKNNRSSCLIAVSPRGSNEAKETAGMTRFFLSKQCDFFRDKPLIETMATNLMTSDPCQLKLTIEGSERSSRHDLGSIDTDLKPTQQ